MLHGSFICQIRYTGAAHLEWLDDHLGYVYSLEDIQQFIEQKRPSLIGLDYNIEFSNQKIFAN